MYPYIPQHSWGDLILVLLAVALLIPLFMHLASIVMAAFRGSLW